MTIEEVYIEVMAWALIASVVAIACIIASA